MKKKTMVVLTPEVDDFCELLASIIARNIQEQAQTDSPKRADIQNNVPDTDTASNQNLIRGSSAEEVLS